MSTQDFNFWKKQIEEHMLFLKLGLTNNHLQVQACQFLTKWQNVNTNSINLLIKNTLTFQQHLQSLLLKGMWIGWISYSFIQHLNDELIYFDKKLNYQLTRNQEIEFWVKHHVTEMEAAEKLLDPLEEQLCTSIKNYIDKVKTLKKSNILNFTYKYLELNEDLKDKMLNKEVLTNISLTLINHVIREGEYCLSLFNTL